ncbi:MAG: cyclic nucleotide-binding domain-containing protein, partial [Verrucomicrobiales bacterium]
MEITKEQIERVAESMGMPPEELESFVALGEKRSFAKGEYLFHESAPRRFFGIVLKGKINLQRGLSGRNVTIACLTEGATIGESLFIDELAHSVSGLALEDVEVWAIAKERVANFRLEKPEIYYQMVGRAARRINLRLRETTEMLLH